MYAERAPAEPLRGLVRRLWYLDLGTPGGMERILPIPFVHVIVNLGDPYEVVRRGDDEVGRSIEAGFVSGLQSRYLVNRNPARLHHVGAELEPFAWRSLGLVPFADDVRRAAAVWPALDEVRAGALVDSSDPERVIAELEALLVAAARGPAPDPAVVALTHVLTEEPGVRIGDAARQVGVAASSLAARFRRATGVSAKSHADVIRFHAFLAEIARPGPLPTWTELVARSTFYDQAHFIRSFTRFTGFTPRDYLRRLGEDGRGAPAFVSPEAQ